jgi:chromosome segregation ATPase
MNLNMATLNKQIEALTTQIAEEARRMEAHTQAKREETNLKLEQAKAEVAKAESDIEDICEQLRTKMAEVTQAEQCGREADHEKQNIEKRIQEANELIKKCGQQRENAWTPYGNGIREVLEQIGRAKWYGEKPVGPLGRFVKVKDPRSWAALLRSQLGNLLTAFAVTDTRDRPALKRLLDQSNK